jgi:signal peptidase I
MSLLSPVPPRLRSTVELILTLAVAAGIAYLAQAFVVKPYVVPTASMVPTLEPNDRLIADRLTLDFRNPHRGEIVVFHPPLCQPGFNQPPDNNFCNTPDVDRRVGPSGTAFVKRVIGLPGETLWSTHGKVWIQPVHGKPFQLNEPYLPAGTTTDINGKISVPQGMYFMMGDNRASSDDSRQWGTEPRGWMIGIARVRYWPLSRLGLF